MEDDFVEAPWADAVTVDAVETATRNGVPARSLAIYSRWWQLETWLRDLAYVELRSKHGVDWENVVNRAVGRVPGRQDQDAAFTHMHGADTSNLLAYLDYSQLLKVIAAEWALFEPCLLRQGSWLGHQEDLVRVRHRIGHVRMPHPDDLGRVEQVLRDLERGAFIALASYNRRCELKVGTDPVTAGWAGSASANADLIAHAARQYEITFLLRSSRRPWVKDTSVDVNSAGVLWHADFFLRGRAVRLQNLWNDTAPARSVLLHMIADPHHVGFTFSGADDGAAVASAIKTAFSAVLGSTSRGGSETSTSHLQAQARRIDFRIVTGSGWDIVGDDTLPISIFGTGGGVGEIPTW